MRLTRLLIVAILLPVAICLSAATAYAALVNINTADATLLDTLPGVGPSKATAIIDYRTKNGPFVVIEDIQKVKGIGPSTFANMKNVITVGASVSQAVQPAVPQTSYEQKAPPPVTPSSSITSDTNSTPHAEAIIAPAVTNELATAGAPLPLAEPVTPHARSTGLFSVWTLGLVGVILIAGGAFILI